MHLEDLMHRTLDDVTYLHDYGTIGDDLWDAYYWLWYYGTSRYGSHNAPTIYISEIQAALSPRDLLTFQEYVDKLKINA